jgi:hypothetical protein
MMSKTMMFVQEGSTVYQDWSRCARPSSMDGEASDLACKSIFNMRALNK